MNSPSAGTSSSCSRRRGRALHQPIEVDVDRRRPTSALDATPPSPGDGRRAGRLGIDAVELACACPCRRARSMRRRAASGRCGARRGRAPRSRSGRAGTPPRRRAPARCRSCLADTHVAHREHGVGERRDEHADRELARPVAQDRLHDPRRELAHRELDDDHRDRQDERRRGSPSTSRRPRGWRARHRVRR